MFRAGGHLVKIRLSPLKFNKTLDDAMQLALRQAIRSWMRAVLQNVPVYSGMARGSLRAVKSIPGLGNIAVPIRPTQNALERVGDRRAEGLALGKASLTANNFRYTFSFESGVPHYRLNEFLNMNRFIRLRSQTPWGSLEFGASVFFNRLHLILKSKFPKIEDLATFEKIIIGRF
jgi:hypothetical protein